LKGVKNAKKQEMVGKLIALHKHCAAYTAMTEAAEFDYNSKTTKSTPKTGAMSILFTKYFVC
jgi:hypothetical protein